MMLMNGFRVQAIDNNAYSVTDARYRVLGGVVRFWVPARDGKGAEKQFRAFGQNFDTLGAAVGEFAKMRGVKLFDAKGDAA